VRTVITTTITGGMKLQRVWELITTNLHHHLQALTGNPAAWARVVWIRTASWVLLAAAALSEVITKQT
jgi:hypothetical protein